MVEITEVSKWEELKERTTHVFGFLLVDVYQSSNYSDEDNKQISEFLEKFVNEKVKKCDGMKWDWGGDGGNFAFLEECDSMVNVAEDILIELNSERRKLNIVEFSVRITLHFGKAKWAKKPQNIAGEDYRWICKNEKIIGLRDAIVITAAVYNDITQSEQKKKFKFYKVIEIENDRIKTYLYNPLSSTNLLEIAERFYFKGEELKKLSLDYNLFEHQVKFLLETAEIKGIVIKKIIISPLINVELEDKIQKIFKHLKRVKVVDYRGQYINEKIAEVAADEVLCLDIKPDSSIAISCGTTIMELAKKLENNSGNIKRINIYPLLITMTAEMEEVSPAGIVSFFTRVFPNSKGYAAQFPKEEVENIQKANDRKKIYSDDCNFLLEGFKEAKYIFAGIGQIGGEGVTHSFNTLMKKLKLEETLKIDLKAVGEICYQPFTIDGELLTDRPELNLLKANIIYADIKELKEKVINKEEDIEIFAIAGGKSKHEAILGGLRMKVFNNLITDITTAEYIINQVDENI